MRETTHPRLLLLAITAVLTLGLTGASVMAPPAADPSSVSSRDAAPPAAAADTVTSRGAESRGAAQAILDALQVDDIDLGTAQLEALPGRTRPLLTSEAVFDPAPVEPIIAVEPPVAPDTAVDPAPGAEEPPAAAPALTVAAAVVPARPRLSIPALGINRTVEAFPCDRAAPPDNYVYRWGCAGKNNLYLLGHAATVFKALHDAYAAGRLAVGMTATWVDLDGTSRTYHVVSWRLVRPTDAAWAIAAQPVPSMTLQTCYGANNEFRLVVRLVS